MSDEKIDQAVKNIEDFFFTNVDHLNKECGEKLYIDFAKEHKNEFINCKLSNSTENKFEYFLYLILDLLSYIGNFNWYTKIN